MQHLYPNCNVVANVNFGSGPVEIRCTETGEHENHVCVVHILSPTVEHKNVFDQNT